ncbi:hypothetical protein CNR22_08830 [Sphingobacteriaceae bacterium]|nr:hypothetical protein CNR22_08830 [Sphingobacteriaceae bacterium]
MKKIITLLVFASPGLISCKKTYVCECTTSSNYTGTTDYNKSSAKTYGSKMTKKQATAACDHEAESIESTFENSFSENGTAATNATVMTSCELK